MIKTLSSVGIITPNTDEISLPSGYYTVTVRLQANSCQDRVLINAMHIYPGMTSKYTPVTIPAPNQNRFTVWFDTNGIDPDGVGNTFLEDTSGASGPDYSARGPKQSVNNAAKVLSPGDPKNDGYDFGGWWTVGKGAGAAGTVSGTQWNIGNDMVFKDVHLYAKWTPGAGMQFTITFDIPSDAGITRTVTLDPFGTPSAGNISDPVSLAEIYSGEKSITLTLTGGTFAGTQWYIDSSPIGTLGDASITIDKNSGFLNLLYAAANGANGSNIINVTGSTGGGYYSANVTVNFN